MKKALVSKYFTKSAVLKITSALNNYSVEQVSDWQADESAKALIIRSKDLVNAKFLKLFPNAEVIVSATSGFDHFHLKDLEHSSVKPCYSPNANINSATEITLFHILNFFKKGPVLLNQKPTKRTTQILGEEVSSKTVGIIGLGRIGSLVATTLNSLGGEVLAFDPYIDESAFKKAFAKSVSLDQLLEQSDIISLHCPLTKLTKNIICKETLLKMKPSSLLVNCARGELINSTALLAALQKQEISGACLDVFENEPLSEDSPLLKLENVITTPHIGGYTAQAQEKSALEAAQQVKNWFEVETPVLSSVPPDAAWKKDLI